MIYPNSNFNSKKYPENKEDIDSLLNLMIGKNGLNDTMTFKEISIKINHQNIILIIKTRKNLEKYLHQRKYINIVQKYRIYVI